MSPAIPVRPAHLPLQHAATTTPVCPRSISNRAPYKNHHRCPLMMSGLRPLSPANGGRADTPLPRFLDNSGLPIDPPVREAREGGGAVEEEMPTLLHRVKHDGSILSLCVSDELIYAGSQSGEIMVWSLETFQLVRSVQAHQGSVLCLYLADHQSVLFSSAGDAIINVWDAKTFENLYSIYSTFDVGDVFCVVYSSALQTTYFGAQNTSIQWYDLKAKDLRPRPTLTSHPSHRNHRFFDSKGPGGRTTPRPASKVVPPSSRLLEVDPENIVQYAHYGYVYCMLLITLPSGWEIGGDGGEMLLSGGGDGVVKLWTINPATSAITSAMSLSAGDSGVLSMAINDTMLYCGLTDGEICIWDLDTRQLIRSLRTHCEDVLTMAVMGNCIFSGSASGYSRKWNQRFEHMSRWQSHSGLILASAATKRHGRLIYITGGNDNCVAIWDASALAQAESQTLRSQNDQLLCSLSKLVSFRTVSSDPSYAEDCRRGATYLKQLFKRYGATATLLPSEGGRNPIVHARFGGCGTKGRNKGKTILFYGHYDVIPASESAGAGWQTRPFELTGMNGYLYGRGVSDNKGPCLAALFAAGELVQEQELDADIMFLIEGEEESGSRGFVDAVRRNKELIGDVDWILLANSYWLDDDVPCLTYGLRGVIHATVVVESDKPDLHSGVEGSRLNREPTIDLVNLLAKLTSSDGKVLIPGFSEPVRPVTPAEEEMYTAITNAIVNKPDWSHLTAAQIKDHLMSKWRFPSLTIHKVSVSGPSNATIIPRAASASISLRIVPDQELSVIKDQLVSYLRSEYSSFNSNNKLNITIDHEAEPWLGDPENDAFRTLEEAVMDVWSEGNEERVRPLYIREGGSIPTARFLEKEFGAPAAHLPCGQASDQAHLDDERLRLVNLYKSKAILKRVFKELPRK